MNMNILTIIKKEKTETLVVDYMKKDIKTNNIELLDFYENILTTNVSDKIIISGIHSESNNKKILEYDTLTLHLREKRQNIPGQIFSMIPHSNGVVCSYLTNNPLSVNLIKINVESEANKMRLWFVSRAPDYTTVDAPDVLLIHIATQVI